MIGEKIMAGYCPECNTINESGRTICKKCKKPLGKLIGENFAGVDDSFIDPLDSEDMDDLGSEGGFDID